MKTKIAKNTNDIQENKENEIWKDKYLRALADYQNLERRIKEDKKNDKKNAAKEIIIKLLPIVNDLIKAQVEIKNKGLDLILGKIDSFLKSEKVEKIDCVNKTFSPDLMECVGIKDGAKEGLVIEQVRPAYTIETEVILPSQVIVGKEKIDSPQEGEVS